jgi:hypothetical protein
LRRYEFSGKLIEPLVSLGGKAVLQNEVLGFDVAEIVQALAKGAQIGRFLLLVAGVPQHADHRKPP